MEYRALTYTEIAAFIQNNGDAYRWERIRQLAVGLFGPEARSVELHIEWLFDGYLKIFRPHFVIGITVYDITREVLSPDMSAPLWQHYASRFLEVSPDYTEEDIQADVLTEICHELDGTYVQGLDYYEQPNAIFDLQTPPPLTIPRLFVAEMSMRTVRDNDSKRDVTDDV